MSDLKLNKLAATIIENVYRATRERNTKQHYRGLSITVYVGRAEYLALKEAVRYNDSNDVTEEAVLGRPLIRVDKDTYFAVHTEEVSSGYSFR
jgi:hypothetical protein